MKSHQNCYFSFIEFMCHLVFTNQFVINFNPPIMSVIIIIIKYFPLSFYLNCYLIKVFIIITINFTTSIHFFHLNLNNYFFLFFKYLIFDS